MKQTQTRIPILDLKPEIQLMKEELDAAYNRVLASGRFILGPEVAAFEESAAAFLDVNYAVGLNSGTDALVIALRAMDIGPGDEVITTPFTFFATAESVMNVGADVVFADIEEETFNIDPDHVESLITEKTKAIIPVHLYGRPAAMDRIMEIAARHNLMVIEDCAQSFGAMYQRKQTGAIGHAGAFSFFPSKNLGAFGDGGLLTFQDERLADRARKLRTHGSIKKYHNKMVGYNSRLDEMQAAFLRVKLNYIAEFNARRRQAAHRYISLLADVDGIIVPSLPDAGHVYHQFTIRVLNGKREEVRASMSEAGIDTMVYYPIPCHKLPVLEQRYADLVLPQSEKLMDQVLSLPIGPFLSAYDQQRIAEVIKESLAK